MTLHLTIDLMDALGQKLASDAQVTLQTTDDTGTDSESFLTSQQIVMPNIPPNWKRLALTVEHPDYVKQAVTLDLDGDNPVYWDNRGCELVMQGTDVNLTYMSLSPKAQTPALARLLCYLLAP